MAEVPRGLPSQRNPNITTARREITTRKRRESRRVGSDLGLGLG
jgi:hypothetical protein